MADELERKADEIVAELRGESSTPSAAQISKPKGLRDKLVNFLKIGNKENNIQLDGILDVLKKGNKLDKKESEADRKERQKEKREKREKLIESLKGGVGTAANVGKKAVSTLVSPFSGVFQKIVDFLKLTVIGSLFNKALNWFGEKENQEKMGRVIRLLKFWWPSILAGYLAFFTPLGGLVTGAIGFLTLALPALAGVIAANPILAAAVAAGGLILGAKALDGDFSNKELTEEEKIENEEKANKVLNDFGVLSMNKGGVVPGSGNRDTVPAMLTPGEFVMSRGAVSRFGTGMMAAMNSAGGGTNKGGPMYEGGGLVGDLSSMREKTEKTENNNFLPTKTSGTTPTPVSIPIKVKSVSNTQVLPTIKKEKKEESTKQPNNTIPTFNILSSSESRQVTLVSLGIEETL